MNSLKISIAIVLFSCMLGCQKEAQVSEQTVSNLSATNRSTITVPAGSVNALAAAVAAAGSGGTVILKAGEHTESGTITIPYTLALTGEPGAVLRMATTPSTNNWALEPQVVEPVLHFKNASGLLLEGLTIKTPDTAPGNTGILIENSDQFRIQNCQIENHQTGMVVVRSSNGRIENCKVLGSTAWLDGDFTVAYGINMVSGNHNFLLRNEASGHGAGIFGSGKNGFMQKNDLHDNATGIILCTFPKEFFELPGGERVQAEYSAHAWKVSDNITHNNFEDGILVIDGANANVLIDNNSFDNGTYDINLTGDLPDYFHLTFPPSKNNLVKSLKYRDVRIKDCGTRNNIIGGKEVDYTLDPC